MIEKNLSSRKKIWAVCKRHCFRGHVRTVHKTSGLKNYKKVIVVVNWRTGYKFEYYQKKKKKPQDFNKQFKTSSWKPEIPGKFTGNSCQ